MTDDPVAPPESASAAGAPVPPPVTLFAFVLAGFGLRHFVPLFLPIDRAWAIASGAAVLALAVALGLASVRSLVRGGSHPHPRRPSDAIVESGVYRVTRNPIYLSMTVTLVGIALLARSGWHLIIAPLFMLAIHFTQIRLEERYLETRFGETYRAYRRRVRRWL
jgi:protein-S-isoprenylcysteine O-methyltransferase Ste14